MNLHILETDEDRLIVVTLSRRNLLALLAKLDEPDSRRTITRHVADHDILIVQAEADDEHYAYRKPGSMAPWTEALMVILQGRSRRRPYGD